MHESSKPTSPKATSKKKKKKKSKNKKPGSQGSHPPTGLAVRLAAMQGAPPQVPPTEEVPSERSNSRSRGGSADGADVPGCSGRATLVLSAPKVIPAQGAAPSDPKLISAAPAGRMSIDSGAGGQFVNPSGTVDLEEFGRQLIARTDARVERVRHESNDSIAPGMQRPHRARTAPGRRTRAHSRHKACRGHQEAPPRAEEVQRTS